MDIKFKTNKLRKQFEPREMVKKWGPQIARKLQTRMNEFKGAENLAEIATLPGPACHQLGQNRDNQFAVTLKEPYRLIFEPSDDPPALKKDGGYDWEHIKTILIIEVVDYHD
ncbi:type II toxin-antitoxin system RelE/ParE family toxin [Bacillus testis]|uniref:type II toxin-antitoxin system RelE/ParE family toxin n=1 Tax=Bacillus testis TaxID=1622072 RepID=UPI00067EBAB7|nr:type II toxin-antitoxin system RelE/ParE family toxin [Bacillus testis]